MHLFIKTHRRSLHGSLGAQSHLWLTCVMRVLQVKKSRPLLLPYLFLFVDHLLVAKFVEAGDTLRWEIPLKPHLPQEHVQRESPHHETRVERESGPQGLHAGPGVSPSFNVSAVECRRQKQHGRFWLRIIIIIGPWQQAGKFELPRRVGECHRWQINTKSFETTLLRGVVYSPAGSLTP